MSELTFRALHQQLMQLYDAKEYTRAFEQIEQEKTNFPESAWEIAYWRLCLHALLGKQVEALRIFRETLDCGLWFSPDRLAHDSDLVSLRPLPEFQQMAEVCRQSFVAIRPAVKPALLIQQPAKPAAVLPLLIALHGNGENADMTIEDWSEITSQDWLIAVPQSSQICDPNTFVWDDREVGISEMREHLATLNSEHMLDPERVVLGGFSAGGGQAVWMALNQSIKACGFVVLAPYLTPAELEALASLLESQRPTRLRGSILVGEQDTECLEVSRKVVEIMRAYHLPCELKIHPGTDHSYPPNFGEYVSEGLAFIEANIHFRHFDASVDLPPLAQLLAEIEEVDHAGEDISAETLKDQLQYPGHDPAQDRWVAVTSNREEQMVGFGCVWKVPQNTFANVYVGVHPAWREQGIGSELLQRTMARAQTLRPESILASADIQHQEAVDFLRKRAFSPVAAYTAMQLAAHRQLPQPRWPVGYTIRTYNPAEDFPVLLDMYNRAFQGLWGHWEKTTAEDLRGFLEHQDPAGIFLLFAQTGEVVGTCRGEMSEQLRAKYGKPTGYLDSPGVVPEQRENGLYLPLLLHAAHWVRNQAPQEAIAIELESWGDSSQVLAEYQAVGFEKMHQQDTYRWQGQ